ncbi:MAG TPA: hypothetical protein VF224_10000 [Aestuariivirga sp.]|jgi:hypothetical protein
MSVKGVDFLQNWIAKNVTAGAPPDDPLSASVLAMRCIAEAAAEGLTLEEIKPDSGSVESHISEAMVHVGEPGTPED